MSGIVKFDITADMDAFGNKLGSIINDDSFKLEVNNTIAQHMDPYVPFLNGPLSQSGLGNVQTDGIHYTVPYAHYQYYGEGFNHTTTFHPKATAKWDKVMMSEKRDTVMKDIGSIISRRAK